MATHRLTFTERVTYGLRRTYRRRSLDLVLTPEQAAHGADTLAAQHSTGDLITSAELVEL